MSLIFTLEEIHPLSSSPDIHKTYLQYFSAYDLPIVEDLVWYFHAFVGFTVQYKWLKAIKAGKFASWPGITYHNSSKYYPIADETLKGNMVQLRQGVRSTNPKPSRSKCNKIPKATDLPSDMTPSNELHIRFEHISKIYTDDTGQFPVLSRSVNKYIILVYNCDSNDIIAAPFKYRSDINTDCFLTTPSNNGSKTVVCWWTSKSWIMKQVLNTSASSCLNGEWNTN